MPRRSGRAARHLVIFAGTLLPSLVHGAAPVTVDRHSFGNPDRVRVRHLDLKLTVDFAAKQLHGTATLTVHRSPDAPSNAPLVLDSRDLTIESVAAQSATKGEAVAVPFQVGAADPILGRSITITLPADHDRVIIRYRTSPSAGALQWLDPAGTAGKRHPFLFTQSEAIQARTWIPLQDSPAVRVTYDATIMVSTGLTAVMAADALPRDATSTAFRFRMDRPIPPYLIALAVGDLAFRPIGPRSGVWAEPSVVEQAAAEFADTEAMIAATEARFGPYRWGRYDLLVLPPSFPFGGMENPKLTFATPTILAGDRSLVALVAHELAHSWSGNLVTNATWRDFWLNEGFTVYIERRIIEAVYGPERAQIEAVLGLQELRDDLARLPSRDTALHLDLDGRDPDDGMTQVAYEKGALFLTQVEHAVGRAKFDAWLLGYFDRHAFTSITTADFVADLRVNLLDKEPEAAKRLDILAWTEAPGLNVPFAVPTSPRLDAVARVAADYAAGRVEAAAVPAAGWSTQEWLHFLRALPDPLPLDRMTALDAASHLTDRPNAEVAAQWLTMAVRAGYRPADARLRSFLTTIGRRKFLMPIYRALLATPEGKTTARTIFDAARPGYHPIAAESVARLLGPP